MSKRRIARGKEKSRLRKSKRETVGEQKREYKRERKNVRAREIV